MSKICPVNFSNKAFISKSFLLLVFYVENHYDGFQRITIIKSITLLKFSSMFLKHMVPHGPTVPTREKMCS